jgi:hypothetical protein
MTRLQTLKSALKISALQRRDDGLKLVEGDGQKSGLNAFVRVLTMAMDHERPSRPVRMHAE